MDADAALAEVRSRAAGRTRYEGQPRPVDEVLAEEVERLRAALRDLSRLTGAQAEDIGLWFLCATAPEAYLQAELRRLHGAIENAARRALENDRA